MINTAKKNVNHIDKTVYIVHVVDTEGPLHESLSAHFTRIEELFGHKIECSLENLKKLQNKKINLGGDEDLVKRVLADKRISTHQNWEQIDKMLDKVTSKQFRETLQDTYDGSWIYNWFCMSHVGITGKNPRRRDLGYHKIFDHYYKYIDRKENSGDLIQWHYHALSLTNDAHRAGSTYLNSNHIYGILSRGIIDRNWFPSVFRAGHNTERPDSHFFLEQWIPFDYSNVGLGLKNADESFSPARGGDWRRAPQSWVPYHPSHDDYQKRGSCRRYIARCLPVDDREWSISYNDVVEAFKGAEKNGSSILSFVSHDFRDMASDVEKMRVLINKCSEKHLNINFKYSNAIEAMRAVFKMKKEHKIDFNVELKSFKTNTRLIIESSNNIFGPQPYLALKTKGGDYVWQNLDFDSKNRWSYSFDPINILIDQIAEIGIAASTSSGLTEVVNINPATGKQKKTILNE